MSDVLTCYWLELLGRGVNFSPPADIERRLIDFGGTQFYAPGTIDCEVNRPQ